MYLLSCLTLFYCYPSIVISMSFIFVIHLILYCICSLSLYMCSSSLCCKALWTTLPVSHCIQKLIILTITIIKSFVFIICLILRYYETSSTFDQFKHITLHMISFLNVSKRKNIVIMLHCCFGPINERKLALTK